MGQINESGLQKLEKIRTASLIEVTGDLHDDRTTRLFLQLSQLIGYRTKVAQNVVKSGYNEEAIKLFDYTNEQIKKLLSI